MKNPRPGRAAPRGYTPEARALWEQIEAGWSIDAAASVIVDTACRALMRMREAQVILAKDGITSTDRFGQLKAHAVTLVERDSATTLLKCFKALNLDLEPLRDQAGRPPGGSSWRRNGNGGLNRPAQSSPT